jgi:5-methylcytosine-specific restriction endonuclease McrA
VLRGWEGFKFIGQESLDRKDPYGHYTIDNVVPACLSCNRKKKDTPYDSYVRSLKLVA